MRAKRKLKDLYCVPHAITFFKIVKEEIENLKQKGFFRIFLNNGIIDLNNYSNIKNLKAENIKVIVDRFVYKKDDYELNQRIGESLEQAYMEGEGYLSNINRNRN